jgi:serine O-acetyltransferase
MIQTSQHDPDVERASLRLAESYVAHADVAPVNGPPLPTAEGVAGICDDLLRLLFPGYLGPLRPTASTDAPEGAIGRLARTLEAQGLRALVCCNDAPLETEHHHLLARQAAWNLIDRLPEIRDVLVDDIVAAFDGDPAARTYREVILAYPGLLATAVYRLAHVLVEGGIPLIPRMMTEHAHSRTGIDIHPGARIGRRFFIDHGTGVVIGETAEIGDGVKLYQGVTLGARSFAKDGSGRVVRGAKRHPTLEDDVTVYSGATILGDVVIGRGSVIGGNVWLTHGVPAHTRVVVSVSQEIRLPDAVEDYRI